MDFCLRWPLGITILILIANDIHQINGQQHEPLELDSFGILNETELTDEMHGNSKCQHMKIPLCEGAGYNRTMLPNTLNHQTQADVNAEINIYHPLLNSGCSPYLQLFLCTFYAPMCFDDADGPNPVHLMPCRSLCESVRRGCTPQFRQFNSAWPPAFRCEQFLERTNNSVKCVGREDEAIFSSNGFSDGFESVVSQSITRDLGFVCPKNFEVASYTLHLNGKNYSNCAKPCEDVLLDKNSTQIVRFSTLIISCISIISTLYTCLVFLANTKRFKYPFKPIIIIAACQLAVATCYLIGFFTDNKIACNDPIDPPKSLPNLNMVRTTAMGNKKGSCTLQFMALYFFQMSTFLWWLMMTISWYMIASLKWAPEAVSGMARYFHFVSWTIPALLTIYLSVLGNIEGDSITGTCYVSFTEYQPIYLFVIWPIAACLVAGTIFLGFGFKSLRASRESLRREYGKQTDEHYKLVAGIGMFSLSFILTSMILLYCHFYERTHLDSWMLTWLSRICKSRDYSMPCPLRNTRYSKPQYLMFIMKYAVTMAVGVISGLFMIPGKVLTSFGDIAELCNLRN